MKTTGPILATGAITIANQTVFHSRPMNWRIPIATGLAAIGFALAEEAWPEGAQILAWTVLVTVIISRTDPGIPSPAESALNWWDSTANITKGA